ncbi:glutathione s-transferase [Plakobranchus ocellatus]|uniref:Glutathione s-transferase n=1 Tax=Plakobranchus ocellatus TaxID=259542 RepID=A0AAV4BMI7_9GAST|nr:glutathione s-transferase [Plakobranchus ocellatus]
MPNYKLTYFDGRGRAEIIRLILTYAGQKFDDNRVGGEVWAKFKPSTPFGQLPVLEIDGNMYAQSTAIANHLAREFGLYGRSNLDAFEIDQVVCLMQDFWSAVTKVYGEKDEAKKAELMGKFTQEEVPKFLGLLEKLLKQNSSGCFVGSDITLADLFVYDLLWNLKSKLADVFEKYPLVNGHQDKVGSVPQIKAYVAARKPTTF